MNEFATHEKSDIATRDAGEPVYRWQGMVDYYGVLTVKPGWAHLKKQFDFVKQISTSSLAIMFMPSLVDDDLFISKALLEAMPPQHPAIRVQTRSDGVVYLTRFSGGKDETGETSACRRVDALHILTRMTSAL